MKLEQIHTVKAEIVLHVLFWLSWIISFTLIQSIGAGVHQYFVWLMYYIITLPIFILHTYLIAYWLLPVTFFKGRFGLFALGFFLFLALFSAIELVVSNELVFKPFDINKSFSPGYLNLQNILISGVGNLYIVLVFLAIKAGRSWYLAKTRKEQLLKSKTDTELEIYQYQLQPKMVQTLIDELEQITETYPDKAPKMIIKISNFLNLFLYEGREELIPLNLEVKLIETFLDIHKQALGSRFVSNFVVNGNVKSFVVPPLLLLPFLNNAFKVVYKCNESFESTVIIKGEKKYLLFSFSFWSEKEFRFTDDESIEITKKRLNNNFPGKHRLIENTDENFREFSLEIFY